MGIEKIYNELGSEKAYKALLNIIIDSAKKGCENETSRLCNILARSEFKRNVIPDLTEKLLEAKKSQNWEEKEIYKKLLEIYFNCLLEQPGYQSMMRKLQRRKFYYKYK